MVLSSLRQPRALLLLSLIVGCIGAASAFLLPAARTASSSSIRSSGRGAAAPAEAPATAGVMMPGRRAQGLVVAQAQEGMHGTGSRFLSVTQLKGDELMPRIIQIAGVYPGLTAQELLAPTSTEAPSYGRWAYDFSDPEGPQMGTVALPASPLVHACVDPVVVIASNDALNIDMRGDHDVEALVLIDRGDRYFQSNKFFAFGAPDGSVVIRWFDQVPAGYTILGRVQYVTLPYRERSGTYKSGWMEIDEE